MKSAFNKIAAGLNDAIEISNRFAIAEVLYEDNRIILELNDGRMFGAKLADGLEVRKGDVIKTSIATVEHEGLDDGVPKNPVVTKIDR